MTTQIYTIGYGNHAPDAVDHLAHKLGAVLVDIRFSAWGKPGYKKFELQRTFGDRYLHVQALGNAAYKAGGMQIADYATGKALLAQLDRPAILMCACGSPVGCHRTVVGAMLRADGFTVTELSLSDGQPPAPVTQISLWDAA